MAVNHPNARVFLGTDPTIANKIKGFAGSVPEFIPPLYALYTAKTTPKTKTRGVSAAGFDPF